MWVTVLTVNAFQNRLAKPQGCKRDVIQLQAMTLQLGQEHAWDRNEFSNST